MAEYSSVQTKWNFDEERMKAISTYMAITEDSFARFTSYKGIEPIEDLFGCLSVVKRAILGTGGTNDDIELKKKFKEIEKIKRDCSLILIENKDIKTKQKDFIEKSIEFYNKAEDIWEFINKLNTKNGLYFRRKDDPRRAVEMW